MPAERIKRAKLAPPDRPFVLVEKRRGAMRIVMPGPEAAHMGIEPGLPLADARGRVPELVAIPHDPAADEAWLDRLARLCLDYSPSVEPDPPQGLMLDITGCAHLHGGEGTLRHALSMRIEAAGFTVHTAFADTPDAARALARFGGDDVRALPLAALAVEEETRTALRRAGFRTIGELAALPRAPLAARFGQGLGVLLDRLLAREDTHVTPCRRPDPVAVDMRFAEPIGRTDDVLDIAGQLMERAAGQLLERGEGGRVFCMTLCRSDGHVARLHVETGAATRDPALVLRLMRERMDSLADPLDPGFGYDAIGLAVPVTEALDEKQQELASQSPKRRSAGPLLDRLAVRHGAGRVLRFVTGDSHIPERAGRLIPARMANAPEPWLAPGADEPPLRPLLLLDPPQQVEVIAAVPDGPPRQFRWRGESYRVTRQEGPERIAPEWWRRKGGHAGNPGRTRDYYRVEDEAGHRFWIFRHGLYGRETDEPCWYVHGVFA